MIDSIILSESQFKSYSSTQKDGKLSNLSKINILIGANNSGKSRFCRTLFLGEDLSFTLRGLGLNSINGLIKSLKSETLTLFGKHFRNDYRNLKHYIETNLNEVPYLENSFNFENTVLRHLTELENVTADGRMTDDDGQPIHFFLNELKQIAIGYKNQITNELRNYPNGFKTENIYIPTLRGLRKIGSDNDAYKDRTIKDYFPKDKERLLSKIYTGLDLYESTKRLLLGTKNDRDAVRDFESFLSKTFFNSKEVNIIPRIGEDVLYVRIDNEEFPIYDLGDGIQSIIILTYPLFFNIGKRLNVFIEEPEHYLHPGLQRIFLETLLDARFSDFQYFITTHSNHFLDITLDINNVSVYTFQKTNDTEEHPAFVIENVDNENHNTLELIGVRNSSVFLSNCTIWVEGITDRIYLRKYLDTLQASSKVKFKEDIHYSFVEYGGNNITHWSFLQDFDPNHPNINVKRLCGKLFLITDRDSAGVNLDGTVNAKATKKQLRHEELKTVLKDRYYCLQCREIENTLRTSVIRQTIEDFEDSNSTKLEYSKAFDDDDAYQNIYLGTFIENNVQNLIRTYKDNSGTIKDKLKFAKKAVEKIKSKEMMSKEALELTQKLLDFVKYNNNI